MTKPTTSKSNVTKTNEQESFCSFFSRKIYPDSPKVSNKLSTMKEAFNIKSMKILSFGLKNRSKFPGSEFRVFLPCVKMLLVRLLGQCQKLEHAMFFSRQIGFAWEYAFQHAWYRNGDNELVSLNINHFLKGREWHRIR